MNFNDFLLDNCSCCNSDDMVLVETEQSDDMILFILKCNSCNKEREYRLEEGGFMNEIN